MTSTLPKHRRDDAGMTLIETLVAMMIMGIVASITYAALISAHKNVAHIDDEYTGLADLKTVEERLSRDLREARGVEPSPTSNENNLVVWIDKNSDYLQAPAEIITWTIVNSTTSPNQFDVVRQDNTGGVQVVGRSVVSDIAFSYAGPDRNETVGPTATDKTNLVRVALTYDAVVGHFSAPKVVGFDVRMRNVA